MHQHRGGVAPGLTVHISDRRLRAHRHRQIGQCTVGTLEPELQIVRSRRVGGAVVLRHLTLARRAAARHGVADHSARGHFAHVGYVPPRCPDAEREVGPARRGVGRGGGGDQPVDRRGRQWAASVVRARRRQRGGRGADVRAFTLGPRGDLELGSAVLLDLELMRVVGRIQRSFAVQRQLQERLAEVGSRGDGERQVEATQSAHFGGALQDLVAVCVGDDVVDGVAGAQRHQVGGTAHRQPPHPPLDPHRLARLVDLPVVEHVPTRLVAQRLADSVHLHDRGLVADSGDDHAVPVVGHCRRQRQCRLTLRIGGDGSTGGVANGHTLDRCTRAQVGGPHVGARRVGQHINAECGALHPRQRRPVLPVVVRVRSDVRHRLNEHDHLSGRTVQHAGEVDVGDNRRVLGVLHAERGVGQHRPTGQLHTLCITSAGIARVLSELRRVSSEHPHTERVVIDRQHRELLCGGERIERGDRLELLDRRRRRTDGHLHLGVAAERLPVQVGERRRDGDLVRGAAECAAADDHRAALQRDLHTGQCGRHHDLGDVAVQHVEHVVELHVDLTTGRALVARGTVRLLDPQRCIGAGVERGRRRSGGGALRRGGSGTDDDGERSVGGQFLRCPERDPATSLGGLADHARRVVGGDLGGGRHTHRHVLAVRLQVHSGQHCGRVDTLVEGGDEHLVERQALGLRAERYDGGRRRGERERHRLCKHSSGGRLRTLGNLDDERGGHRQTIDGVARGVEAQCASADPLPVSGYGGGQPHRHGGGIQLADRGDRHHRLVERDRQVRGDRHGTVGLMAQHVQRAGGHGVGRCGLTRREDDFERATGPRRRRRLGWPVELLLQRRTSEELGQQRQDLAQALCR
ncbi:unannotated protein [freshwater metagenome]|uniref:Unannotated protein n=1 Tax=freshwater metagenome TaxID=449393 RepID=A0A6J6ZW60_9ZZZZ